MRIMSIVAALPLLALAACGGAGPETAGGIAPPTGASGNVSGGTGAGVTAGPSGTTPAAATSFLSVGAETSFTAIGGMHSLTYKSDTNGTSEFYQGNASTPTTPSGTISYSPRDGIFTIAFSDTKAGVTNNTRFQDPAHRDDLTGQQLAALQVPSLVGFNYLVASSPTDTTTFFYQRPNATLYVSLAGFAHTATDGTGALTERDRGVFAFGTPTVQAQIPISGAGTYKGGFLATAVLDTGNVQPSVMQWIAGDSAVKVDFGASTVALSLNGTVGDGFRNGTVLPSSSLAFPAGTAFTATGTATIDLLRTGGFSGAFGNAALGGSAIDFSGIKPGNNVAGASSIDGAFFGPNAVNVGGSFRIVGGVPNQRVDIQGAFTGSR